MGQTVAGILAAAAIIAALVVIVRAMSYLISVLRKVSRLVDDLTGEPPRPGFPDGRPGVLDRLTSMEHGQAASVAILAALEVRVAAMEAQFQPNGGETLRDAVDRAAGAAQPSTAAAEVNVVNKSKY